MTNTLRKKVEEILEQTCGFTCPNGAEENKPGLDAIIDAFKASMPKEKMLHEECKGLILTDERVLRIQNEISGYNQALSDMLKVLEEEGGK